MKNTTAIRGEGYSMQPLISPGDTVYYRRVLRPKDVRWGDILVYFDRRELIAHRVVWKNHLWMITKGDNCSQWETVAGDNRIAGIVTGVRKKSGLVDFSTGKARIANGYITLLSFMEFIVLFFSSRLLRCVFRGRRFLVRRAAGKN